LDDLEEPLRTVFQNSSEDVAQWILTLAKHTRCFHGEGASNNSGVIEIFENMDFQCFRALRLRQLRKLGQHYYMIFINPLSPFQWPKIGLHDLNGHFSLFIITNRVSAITLHIYRRAIYRIFLLNDVTSRDVRKRNVKTVIRRILWIDERIAGLQFVQLVQIWFYAFAHWHWIFVNFKRSEIVLKYAKVWTLS